MKKNRTYSLDEEVIKKLQLKKINSEMKINEIIETLVNNFIDNLDERGEVINQIEENDIVKELKEIKRLISNNKISTNDYNEEAEAEAEAEEDEDINNNNNFVIPDCYK